MNLTRAFALMSFFYLAAVPVRAAEFPPVTPEEVSLSSVPEQPEAPAVILYRERTDDDINRHHHIYVRLKVLRDAGRDAAEVEVPFSTDFYHIGEVTGRTLHPDGSITPFTLSASDRVTTRGQGAVLRTTGFTLPDVQPGNIIDYQYDVRYTDYIVNHQILSDRTYFFSAPEWNVQDKWFTRKAVFRFIPVRSNVASGYYVGDKPIRGAAWSSFLPASLPQPQVHRRAAHATSLESETDLRNLSSEYIDLELTNIPPVSSEPYMPPANMLRWRVQFYYVTEDNKADFWKSRSKRWDNQANDFVNANRGVREAVGQIVSASDTPELKVRKIYSYIAGLDHWSETPGQEAPNQNAGGVLERKGGTHDDLNRLFTSMLRAAGLETYLIWVPDRSQQWFDDNFLSTNQLKAEIAIVIVNGQEVFLDPGSRFCPYGYLDWRYAGVRGIRQTSRGTGQGETPASNYKQAVVTRGASLQLAADRLATGTITLTFMGLQAMTRRQEGSKTGDAGRRRMLEDELRALLPANSGVSLINQPDWQDAEPPLVAQFKVTVPLAVKDGQRWRVPQHVFQINEPSRFQPAQRTYPIYFDYPWHEVDETHISVPAGMQVESLAPDNALQLDYARYTSLHKIEAPGKIFARRDLVMASGTVEVAKYKDLKGFFDGVKKADDQTALLKLTESAAVGK